MADNVAGDVILNGYGSLPEGEDDEDYEEEDDEDDEDDYYDDDDLSFEED